MPPHNGSLLRTTEVVFAALVLLIVTLLVTDFPHYPSWPTLGPVPINPELVVPGLLGVAVLLGSVTNGFNVKSAVFGVFGGLTLLLATVSLHSLYTDTTGGSFGGGILTLTVAVPLAIIVLSLHAIRTIARYRA